MDVDKSESSVLRDYAKSYLRMLGKVERKVKIVLSSECCNIATNDNSQFIAVSNKSKTIK